MNVTTRGFRRHSTTSSAERLNKGWQVIELQSREVSAEQVAEVQEHVLGRAHPLPVLNVVVGALRDVARDRRTVARLGMIPFAIAVVIHTVSTYVVPGSSDPGTRLLVGFVSSLPWILFVVPFYRLALSHDDVDPPLQWTTAHSVAFAWSAVKSAAWVGTAHLPEEIVAVAVTPALSYLFARFCFVVPSTAAGDYPDLRLAWNRSRGNGWRLVAIRFLIWVMALVPVIALTSGLAALGFNWRNMLLPSSFVVMAVVEVVGAASLVRSLRVLRASAAAADARW